VSDRQVRGQDRSGVEIPDLDEGVPDVAVTVLIHALGSLENPEDEQRALDGELGDRSMDDVDGALALAALVHREGDVAAPSSKPRTGTCGSRSLV
jgi:hypothetical protein